MIVGPRSIPAGAGEPISSCPSRLVIGVYPRGCGGTGPIPTGPATPRGLSPRVRGNLPVMLAEYLAAGSIPAGAGEPEGRARGYSTSGVYPRGCGGTVDEHLARADQDGLSPRVRGNPQPALRNEADYGSIPAGAGEPLSFLARATRAKVYPRGCGGTLVDVPNVALELGLSPRVRGNRAGDGAVRHRDGSIPAGAGEPLSMFRTSPSNWVYPRGCGGTRASTFTLRRSRGLSPRVRGNHLDGR